MKRRMGIIVLLMGLVAVSGFSWGIGAAGSYGLETGTGSGGGALTVSHPVIPGTVLGVKISASGGTMSVGLTDDWWLVVDELAGALAYYVGAGGYLQFSLGDTVAVDLGARIPVGLRLFPIDPLELFIEVAPTIGVGFNDFQFPTWGFQGAFGARFWFE